MDHKTRKLLKELQDETTALTEEREKEIDDFIKEKINMIGEAFDKFDLEGVKDRVQSKALMLEKAGKQLETMIAGGAEEEEEITREVQKNMELAKELEADTAQLQNFLSAAADKMDEVNLLFDLLSKRTGKKYTRFVVNR